MSLQEKSNALRAKILTMPEGKQESIAKAKKAIMDLILPLGVDGYLATALVLAELTPGEEEIKRKKPRGFKVTHDGESIALELCCFCWKRTCYWYTPKDVACCQECAKTHNRSEVPTKKKWIEAVEERRRNG